LLCGTPLGSKALGDPSGRRSAGEDRLPGSDR
jgi:hypothetical protein